MKKIICNTLLTLSLIGALALTACDGGTPTPSPDREPPVTTEHVHDFGEWKQTKEPTCLAEGEQQKSCSCGEKETETLAKAEDHTDDGNGACKHCGTPLAPTAGIIYELSEDGSYAIATGYEGTATKVMIADTYNGKPVTEVGASAFYNKSITTVIIPDSVKKIGDNAFYGCNFTEISISNNLTELGDYAFSGFSTNICTTYEHLYYLGNEENPYLVLYKAEPLDYTNREIVIHPDTKFIHSYAFQSRTIKSLTIPDGIIQIGSYAFYESKLESITLGTGITELSTGIFKESRLLSEITVKGTLTKIGESAFSYCKALTTFTIPGTVTYIGDYAFSNSGLTSAIMPNSVTFLGDAAFCYCESLHTIVMSDALEEIPYYAFQGCRNLKTLKIGANVKKIKYESVMGCVSLERLVIPDSVTEIQERAFNSCIKLNTIVIGRSLQLINNAFYNCQAITDIYFTASQCDESRFFPGDLSSFRRAARHYNYQPD